MVAAASSVLFDAADFAGGVSARRVQAPLVSAFSRIGAIALLLIGEPLLYESIALGPVSACSIPLVSMAPAAAGGMISHG